MNELTLRPSSAERYAACPGAVLAEHGIPDLPAGADADMGHRIHQLMELRLLEASVIKPDPARVRKLRLEVEGAGLDEEETSNILFTRAVHPIAEHGGIRQAWVEHRVELKVYKPDSDSELVIWRGTPDLRAVMMDGTLHVFDWKAGYNDPPAAVRNLQLRVYCMAARQMHDDIACNVHGHIVTRWGRSEVVYTPERADEYEREVTAVWRDAMEPDAPRCPGAHCEYCPAKLSDRCPESAGMSTAMIALGQAGLTVERLGELLDLCAPLEKAINAVKERARAVLAENPEALAGRWFLTAPSQMRSVTDAAGAQDALAAHLDAREFLATCKTSLAGLTAAVRAKTGLKQKDAEAVVVSSLGGLVSTTERAPMLKRKG